MDSIFDHYKKTGYLHHAHVVEGIHGEVLPLLVNAIEKNLGVMAQNNPDFTVQYYESLGVDEARGLKEAQTRAAFGGARKIFIVGTNSFTREAQNALLKTFEEPTEGTHFFIILPRIEMLLPTLRSRVLVVSSNFTSKDESSALAEKFLDASLEERFAIVKKMAEKKTGLNATLGSVARTGSTEPVLGKTVDRELFRRTLDHMERILYTRTAGEFANSDLGPKQISTANIFREIFQAKTYLADRGSSPKMLLEHIAIVLNSC